MELIIFIDTCHQYENYTKEDYLEWLKESEEISESATINDICEDAYIRWHNDMCNLECDDFMTNLKYSQINKEGVPIAITGCLGLWDGHHEIAPTVCDNIVDAVNKCIDRADDFSVTFDGDELIVNSYHHDGCNSFSLHALNAAGRKRFSEIGGDDGCFKKYHFKKILTKKNPYLF